MNPQAIAIHFADELNRSRALTDREADMLDSIVGKKRRLWTQAEDRELKRMRRKRMTAPEIAVALGRSSWGVRMRVNHLKRKEA